MAMQVVIDSLLVHYQRRGKGRTVILLHGWGDSSQGLTELTQTLSKQFDIVAIDLPGFGGSEAPEQDWGLDEYAACIARLCSKLQLTPYAYVGHSNGGAIAIRGLANGTLHAEKLVLLASAGVRGEYKGRVKLLRLVTKAGKAVTAPLPRAVKGRLQKKFYTSIGSDMLVAENLQGTFKKIVQDDVRQDAARLLLPVLLLYGTNDEATPPSWGRKLAAAIPKAEFIEIPEAGHFIHRDAAAECEKQIKRFLR